MTKKQWLSETDLIALAKKYRRQSGKTRAQAAREMGVKQTSIFNAEESPEQSLTKLRSRLIEAYSPFKVAGPMFRLKRK